MGTGKGEAAKGTNLLKFIQPVQVVTDCSDFAFINKMLLFFKHSTLTLSVVHMPSTRLGFFALKIIELNQTLSRTS